MGVIPLPSGHPSATTNEDCRLCARMKAPDAGLASSLPELRQTLPLAFAVTVGLLLAAIDHGPAGWLGVASPPDVAKLRSQLDQSEATVRMLTERGREREHRSEQLVRQISRLRERLAEIAMAASLTGAGKKSSSPPHLDATYFTWGLHLDGPRARLELQTAANGESPARVRVMDRDGQIVAVSGLAVVSLDGNLEFQLEPPLDLIADLDDGQEIDYAIEALVDDEWKPVRLTDTGRRTRSVVDVEGRLSRVPATPDASRLSEAAHSRRSALN